MYHMRPQRGGGANFFFSFYRSFIRLMASFVQKKNENFQMF